MVVSWPEGVDLFRSAPGGDVADPYDCAAAGHDRLRHGLTTAVVLRTYWTVAAPALPGTSR